jgi:Spy/CpxP family protein refolding chaperone
MRMTLAGVVMMSVVIGAAAVSIAQPVGPAPSPYAPQMGSPVRGLSQQEIDDLRDGRGAGLARTAELNGYPGPVHALELRDKLGLSPAQVKQIEELRDTTIVQAQHLGAEIIEREARLSAAFAGRTITEREMAAQVSELGRLYAQLRVTHLRAHLAMRSLLSETQVAQYNALRGYTMPGQSPGMPHQHP